MRRKDMRIQHSHFILAALLSVGLTLAPARFVTADTPPPDANAPTMPTVFTDASGTLKLVVHLQQGYADVGQFDVAVSGLGVYEGTIPTSQNNAHVEHLQGTVTAQASASDASAAPPATVKMEGIVDPTDLTANINIWINKTHYHLKTDNGSASDAATVVQQILPLLQAQDWNTLYPYMADQIRAQYTQAQFVQALNSQSGAGTTLASLATSGPGQASVNPLGYAYYQQPIAEQTRAADGSTTTSTVNLYLVREDGAWHYASTDPAPNDPVIGEIEAGQS